ncbi:hypothetical protein FNH09_05300 [Streptomyces adustus]|uniref:Uncharacterized protein n=1 Tax=Streptomyces adustus TaxID=1609272 RepID=A0A5N8V6N3_9ACTN|nr:hypothetical protein [Streptomyces adustus]MPY30749.1 hypothetical protein [Streptomyces adustus]
MAELSTVCFEVAPDVAREVTPLPHPLERLAVLAAYFDEQPHLEQAQRTTGAPLSEAVLAQAGSAVDDPVANDDPREAPHDAELLHAVNLRLQALGQKAVDQAAVDEASRALAEERGPAFTESATDAQADLVAIRLLGPEPDRLRTGMPHADFDAGAPIASAAGGRHAPDGIRTQEQGRIGEDDRRAHSAAESDNPVVHPPRNTQGHVPPGEDAAAPDGSGSHVLSFEDDLLHWVNVQLRQVPRETDSREVRKALQTLVKLRGPAAAKRPARDLAADIAAIVMEKDPPRLPGGAPSPVGNEAERIVEPSGSGLWGATSGSPEEGRFPAVQRADLDAADAGFWQTGEGPEPDGPFQPDREVAAQATTSNGATNAKNLRKKDKTGAGKWRKYTISFPETVKSVPPDQIAQINGLASHIFDIAERNWQEGRPLPRVEIVGYGHGRTFSINRAENTGQARADATREVLERALAGAISSPRITTGIELGDFSVSSRSGGQGERTAAVYVQFKPEIDARPEDVKRIKYSRAAAQFEKNLGWYLIGRPKALKAVQDVVKGIWRTIGTHDPENLALLGTELPYSGAVGTNLGDLSRVVHSGNIRELSTMLLEAVFNRALRNVVTQLPRYRDFPEIANEHKEEEERDAHRTVPLRAAWSTYSINSIQPPLSTAERNAAKITHDPYWEYVNWKTPFYDDREWSGHRPGTSRDEKDLPLDSALHRDGNRTGGLVGRGTSGALALTLETAWRLQQRFGYEFDFPELRLALMGHMLVTRQHTLHELMRAAHIFDEAHNGAFGFRYLDGWSRYRYLYPLTEKQLRDNVGSFPDEIALDIEAPQFSDQRVASGLDVLRALKIDPDLWAKELEFTANGQQMPPLGAGIRLDAWSRYWQALQNESVARPNPADLEELVRRAGRTAGRYRVDHKALAKALEEEKNRAAQMVRTTGHDPEELQRRFANWTKRQIESRSQAKTLAGIYESKAVNDFRNPYSPVNIAISEIEQHPFNEPFRNVIRGVLEQVHQHRAWEIWELREANDFHTLSDLGILQRRRQLSTDLWHQFRSRLVSPMVNQSAESAQAAQMMQKLLDSFTRKPLDNWISGLETDLDRYLGSTPHASVSTSGGNGTVIARMADTSDAMANGLRVRLEEKFTGLVEEAPRIADTGALDRGWIEARLNEEPIKVLYQALTQWSRAASVADLFDTWWNERQPISRTGPDQYSGLDKTATSEAASSAERVLPTLPNSAEIPAPYASAGSGTLHDPRDPVTSTDFATTVPDSADALLEQFSLEVRPAVRVWDPPIAGQAVALEKDILTTSGARAVVFLGDQVLWAVNTGSTITWFDHHRAQSVPRPVFADHDLIASIDMDPHGQLIGPKARSLKATATILPDRVRGGFCDLNLGADLHGVLGWSPARR